MKTEDISHLRWIHDRFIYVYGENQDVDYLIKLRSIIAELEALQSRSCETCGYLGLDYDEQEICRNGDLDINIRSVYKNLYCNRHKPKEKVYLNVKDMDVWKKKNRVDPSTKVFIVDSCY